MQAYHLPEQIHFCEIGGERVFLDLARDRYFSLPPAADAAFSLLMSDGARGGENSGDIAFLVRAGVLVEAPNGKPIAPTRHPRPTRSAVEGTGISEIPGPAILLETWRLVLSARRTVARRKLPGQLRSFAGSSAEIASAPPDGRADAIAQFRAARRFVPIDPNCLYDSLALRQFLRSRCIATTLIIGAKLHPFGAHCWLQDGEEVLNDSLGSARDFEPILVT